MKTNACIGRSRQAPLSRLSLVDLGCGLSDPILFNGRYRLSCPQVSGAMQSSFCACPTERDMRAYYDELLEKKGLSSVIQIQIRNQGATKSIDEQDRGLPADDWMLYKSVHAKRSFKSGDIVFVEDPLVCMQHIDNSTRINCCGGCLRFIQSDAGDESASLCCQVGSPEFMVRTWFCNDCSQASIAAAVHKEYLCAKRGSKEKLADFFEHAAHTNDVFVLAAKVICHVLYSAKAKGFEGSWRPYAMGYKMPWWESVAKPDDVPDEEEAEFRSDLKELAQDSFHAFCRTLQELHPEDYDRYYGNFLSLEVWGSLIGMFELNNLNILARGPEVEDSAGNDEQGDIEDADQERDLVEGSGFYGLHSCFNHSCDPNCRVLVPRHDTENAKVIVQVVQDVEVGEELTVSYIEEDEPYNIRQQQLRDYGFECQCERCVMELEFVG
jgi:hypothetical protein